MAGKLGSGRFWNAGPDMAAVRTLADEVEAGKIVTAGLTDGTFVALMVELQARGIALAQRSEAERYLQPWLFRVLKQS